VLSTYYACINRLILPSGLFLNLSRTLSELNTDAELLEQRYDDTLISSWIHASSPYNIFYFIQYACSPALQLSQQRFGSRPGDLRVFFIFCDFCKLVVMLFIGLVSYPVFVYS